MARDNAKMKKKRTMSEITVLVPTHQMNGLERDEEFSFDPE